MRRPLRVDAAAERAGAALDAAARVAADRPAARAQRLRALGAELPVSAQRLEVERRDGEDLLRRPIERVEVGRPVDALAIPPLLEHLPWSAEAGAGVDHRGPAHGAADRNRDRGLAQGDRHAAVAVEERHRLERIARVAGAIDVGPGLQDQHIESGLGERRRRGGTACAGPDDGDVALLALAPRLEVAEAGGRRLGVPSATAQRYSKPIALRTRSSRAQPIIARSLASRSRSR